ncbi:hypothetical protein GF366_02995 [Candidatus Peregrinibacteria bacterium]|nr:hypothetical protein [Candidatus Peregrinibacteria bacterium]
MIGMIKYNTVNTLFKVDLEKVIPAAMLKRSQSEVENVSTNKNQIQAPLSGERETISRTTLSPQQSENPVIVKATGPSSNSTTPHQAPVKKVGRNEPCPCGSGKKYKKCCGR